MTLRPEAIERMARAMRARDRGGDEWDAIADSDKAVWRGLAAVALDRLESLLAERGCRVVVEEPTREMLRAADKEDSLSEVGNYGRPATAEDHWHAMLAAAPPPLAKAPAHE